MVIKVGVWGPGSMGVIALRGVIDHPELQLVDLVVHSDAKAGRDAGELCGIAPVGVAATQDPAALLAGDADAVVYAAGANLRPLEAVGDMVVDPAGRQERGVVFGGAAGVSRRASTPAFTDPLRRAALDGGVSFFTTGIDSGFANDVLPLVLTGVSRVIESVRVTEMFNYATYPDQAAVYEILGFGKPPEYQAFAAQPGMFTFGWGPVLHQLAAGLGVKIDNIEESNERARRRRVLRHAHRPHRRRDDRGHALHADRIRRRQADFRPRPRDPDARRHRAGLAAAEHLDPAEGPRLRRGLRDAVSTAWRSRDPRACGANSRWPTTTTTTWVRASPAPRGWSTPSRRCARRRPGCCRRWTCH